MRRFAFAAFVILVGASFIGNGPALAYTSFDGSNNCSQCHSGFDSYGAAVHQTHISETACSTCHATSGDNPLIETCSACHDANLLWNYHLQFAPADGSGFTCGTCHTITPTESYDWDAVKALYYGSLQSK